MSYRETLTSVQKRRFIPSPFLRRGNNIPYRAVTILRHENALSYRTGLVIRTVKQPKSLLYLTVKAASFTTKRSDFQSPGISTTAKKRAFVHQKTQRAWTNKLLPSNKLVTFMLYVPDSSRCAYLVTGAWKCYFFSSLGYTVVCQDLRR